MSVRGRADEVRGGRHRPEEQRRAAVRQHARDRTAHLRGCAGGVYGMGCEGFGAAWQAGVREVWVRAGRAGRVCARAAAGWEGMGGGEGWWVARGCARACWQLPCRGEPRCKRRRGEPKPWRQRDVAGASPFNLGAPISRGRAEVPLPMWASPVSVQLSAGWAQSGCRSGGGKPSPSADVGGAHGRLGNADGADRQRLRTHGCERHAQLEAHGRASVGCGKRTLILGANVGAGAGPVVVQMCDRRDTRARLGMGAAVAGCRLRTEGRGEARGMGTLLVWMRWERPVYLRMRRPRGEPSPGADVGWVRQVYLQMRRPRGEPSPSP